MPPYLAPPSPSWLSPDQPDSRRSDPGCVDGLGDLLPDLALRGVKAWLVPAGLAEKCEDCLHDAFDQQVDDAAVWVAHRAPDAGPDGYVHRAPVCVLHLWDAVIFQIRRGALPWVEIPVPAAVAA